MGTNDAEQVRALLDRTTSGYMSRDLCFRAAGMDYPSTEFSCIVERGQSAPLIASLRQLSDQGVSMLLYEQDADVPIG